MREGERLGRAHLHYQRLNIPRFDFKFFLAESPLDLPVATGYMHRLIARLIARPPHQWGHRLDNLPSRHDRAQHQSERDDELLPSRQRGKPLREPVSPTSSIPHRTEGRTLWPCV